MSEIIKLDCGLHSSRRTQPVWYIVCHHTVTRTPEATQRVLRARGLSTHYEVAPDGRIYEYLDPEPRVAWHARAWNARGIGVDLTGPPGRTTDDPVTPYPDAQVQALAWLVWHLAQRFNLPSPDRGNVVVWRRNPRLSITGHWQDAGMRLRIVVVPHSAIQRGKVDPSDWRLDGTAWDTVLRPAILGWPGAATNQQQAPSGARSET